MRSLGGLIGLLVTVLIAGFIYKYFLGQSQTPGVGTPVQTIDIVGVKNDLLAIGQAERAYEAEHGSFASLGELTSSGAMSIAKKGRDGYIYEVQTETDNFHVIARCPSVTFPGCPNYSIDQAMEIQAAP